MELLRFLTRAVEQTPLNPLTVDDLIDQYLAAEGATLAPSTMKVRRSYLQAPRRFYRGRRVALMSPRDTDEYRTWRVGQDTLFGTANNNTASYELRALRTAFNWAVRRQMLARNPILGANLKTTQSERSLTWEAHQVVRTGAAGNVQLEAIVDALYDSGMRIGEVIKNTIDNLRTGTHEDTDGLEHVVHCLVIPSAISKTRRQRTVILRPESARKLRELPRTSRWLVESTQRRGRPISPSTVRLWLAEAAQDAGVTAEMPRSPYPHSLRHTYGTDAMRAGVNPKGLMKSMGHQSLRMTDRYTHADLSDQVGVSVKTWARRDRQLERKPPKPSVKIASTKTARGS